MRSKLRIFSVLTLASCLLALNSPAALAKGVVYFEFAPDAWASQRLIVTAGATPYQVFQPASDFTLTGYDLWVDNTGEAGPVTFTLAKNDGTTLATNYVTLPELPAIPGGNRLHINLVNDIPLHAGEKYSIGIDSSLLGFGLYYADRITFLDHNQDFTTEYVNGIARLGSVQQSFTFKFSLRTPISVGGATDNTSDPSDVTPENQTPAQQISISNARVVAVTDKTVTLAWTTDIASDSRIAIRSQLSPLYVVSSGYDPTLELEHTVTAGGLLASGNYFADVFSSNGSELVLTTYTIGFKTLTHAQQLINNPPPPEAPTPAQPASPTPVTPTAPPAGSQPATTPANSANTGTVPAGAANSQTNSQQNQNANSADSGSSAGPSHFPNVQVSGGSGNNTTLLKWDAPASGEPTDGYRIDIFDVGHNLVRQFYIPRGSHDKQIAELTKGLHSAVIYAKNGDVYTKVAPPASFLVQSKDMGILWKVIALAILWVVTLGGYFTWKFKKEKTVLPPEEGYDPNR